MMQQRTDGLGHVNWRSVEIAYQRYLQSKRRKRAKNVQIVFCKSCFETEGTLLRITPRRSRLVAGAQPEYMHKSCKVIESKKVKEANKSLIAGG